VPPSEKSSDTRRAPRSTSADKPGSQRAAPWDVAANSAEDGVGDAATSFDTPALK